MTKKIGEYSHTQYKLILAAFDYLAEKGNVHAKMVKLALEKVQTEKEKRKVIAAAFSEMYSILLVLDMAIKSSVSVEEFKKRLSEM